VPQLLGLTVDQARAVAQQGGWTLVEAPAVANAAVAPGLITAQQPEQGIALEAGAPITVTTSAGPPTAVPAPPPPTATAAPPAPAPVAPAPPPQPEPGDKGPDKGKGKGNDKGKGGH
jgi:beta-lactam-binding protein with PASTA domain